MAAAGMHFFGRLPAAVVALLANFVLAWPIVASAAGTVALEGVTLNPRLQAAIDSSYGKREAATLERMVADSLGRELKRAGLAMATTANFTVQVLIEDAMPTHPTDEQLQRNPSIDRLASVSLGGATLSAILRGADGGIVDRVSVRHYAPTLAEVSAAADPWSDARLAIDSLAHAVAASSAKHVRAPPH